MKWLMVWNDSGYEMTLGMKWRLVWSDSWYEVTLSMKWLRYEVEIGWSEHNFSLWYEVTPKMKCTWYEVSGSPRDQNFAYIFAPVVDPYNLKRNWGSQMVPLKIQSVELDDNWEITNWTKNSSSSNFISISDLCSWRERQIWNRRST